MLTSADLTALWLTLQLAGLTTFILLLLGTPLAWWLAHTRWRFRFVLETFIALPLVLPPTVLGFYLLLALGPRGWLGSLMQSLGADPLAFTFEGLLVGSVIYSLPFVVQPLQDTFQSIGRRPLEIAATLRANPLDTFLNVVIPMARAGYVTAAMLGFAHTLGEFGVVLMVGGAIPGETRTAAIAIYDRVQAFDDSAAASMSAMLLVICLVALLLVQRLTRRIGRRRHG